ncbi:TlpA disulfide reductase family protein [Gordonia shandongensis]|uniref:TlpA disulfide reductase family protein n=1 Tax=Gordonia shandongensis TaxID=376351 RepID=UPI00040C8369|nr:TlpA disulfide reductase family protein [Gordonia shandongensis]
MTFLKEPATRATIAFVIVVIALIAALWPRGGDDSAEPPASPSGSTAASAPAEQPVSDDELARTRAEAALRPCPADDVAPADGAVLAGVSAPCMATDTTIDVGRATAGKPLVINMWAVWCLPCRHELPVFDELSQRAGDRLNVLAVHAREGGDQPFAVLDFLRSIDVHLPVITDPHGAVAKAVRAPRIFPSTLLIDADGTVVATLPQVFSSVDELADVVREHLGVDV